MTTCTLFAISTNKETPEEFGPLEVEVYGEKYKFPKGVIYRCGHFTHLLNEDGSPYCHPNTYLNGVLDLDSGPLEKVLFCKDIGIPVRTRDQLAVYKV